MSERGRVMEYGPIEVLLVGAPRDVDLQRVVSALRRPVDDGHARVIDLVLLTRLEDGTLEACDVEDAVWPGPALAGLQLDPHRLLSDPDLELLAESLGPDEGGVVVVLEHTWARAAATSLDRLGARLVTSERIPAAVAELAFAIEDAS